MADLVGDIIPQSLLELFGQLKPNVPIDAQADMPSICLQPGVARA